MKIKNIILLIIIFPIVFVMAVIGIQNISLFFPMHVDPPLIKIAQSGMDEIGLYLVKYYETVNVSGNDIKISDVVNFLESEQGLYYNVFFQEPASTFGSPLNYSIYLCLPKELKSETPTIIAYTEPIEERGLYRIALFLYGVNMTAVRMDSNSLEKVLGLDKLDETPIPDFYLCFSTTKK